MNTPQTQTTSSNSDPILGITFNETKQNDDTTPKTTTTDVDVQAEQNALSDELNGTSTPKRKDTNFEAGTIIHDRKRQKPSLAQNLQSAFGELWGRVTGTLSDGVAKVSELSREEAQPYIPKASTRKDVIQQAATYAHIPPKDDHDVIVEKIHATQKEQSSEKKPESGIVIKEAQPKKTSWTHIEDDTQNYIHDSLTVPQNKTTNTGSVSLISEKNIPTPPVNTSSEALQLHTAKNTHDQKYHTVLQKIRTYQTDIARLRGNNTPPTTQTPSHNTAPSSEPAKDTPPQTPILVKEKQSKEEVVATQPVKILDLRTTAIAPIVATHIKKSISDFLPEENTQPVPTPNKATQPPEAPVIPVMVERVSNVKISDVVTQRHEVPPPTPTPVTPVTKSISQKTTGKVTIGPVLHRAQSDLIQQSITPPKEDTTPKKINTTTTESGKEKADALTATPVSLSEIFKHKSVTPPPTVEKQINPPITPMVPEVTKKETPHAQEPLVSQPKETIVPPKPLVEKPVYVPEKKVTPPPPVREVIQPATHTQEKQEHIENMSVSHTPIDILSSKEISPTLSSLHVTSSTETIKDTPLDPPLTIATHPPLQKRMAPIASTTPNQNGRTFTILTRSIAIAAPIVLLAWFGVRSYITHSTQSTTDTVRETPQIPTILETNNRTGVPMSGTRYAFLTALSTAVSQASQDFVQLYPSVSQNGGEQVVSTKEFFGFLMTHLDAKTTRSLEDTYMLGSVHTTKNEPFLILKTHNYETLFAGMLLWEPYLYEDFAPFFGESQVAYSYFRDAVRNNAPARILYDDEKKELLVYSFVDEHTVIITTSSEALTKIIERK